MDPTQPLGRHVLALHEAGRLRPSEKSHYRLSVRPEPGQKQQFPKISYGQTTFGRIYEKTITENLKIEYRFLNEQGTAFREGSLEDAQGEHRSHKPFTIEALVPPKEAVQASGSGQAKQPGPPSVPSYQPTENFEDEKYMSFSDRVPRSGHSNGDWWG